MFVVPEYNKNQTIKEYYDSVKTAYYEEYGYPDDGHIPWNYFRSKYLSEKQRKNVRTQLEKYYKSKEGKERKQKRRIRKNKKYPGGSSEYLYTLFRRNENGDIESFSGDRCWSKERAYLFMKPPTHMFSPEQGEFILKVTREYPDIEFIIDTRKCDVVKWKLK